MKKKAGSKPAFPLFVSVARGSVARFSRESQWGRVLQKNALVHFIHKLVFSIVARGRLELPTS